MGLLLESQPKHGLKLSDTELAGLREYEREQQRMDEQTFSYEPINVIEPVVNLAFRKGTYILKPGTGRITRRPHKHTAAEERSLEERRAIRKIYQKNITIRCGGVIKGRVPNVPTWELKAPSTTEYYMLTPIEDFYDRYDESFQSSIPRNQALLHVCEDPQNPVVPTIGSLLR